MMRLTLPDVTQKQFMLIIKAGFAAYFSKEKSKQYLESHVMAEFTEAIQTCNLPPMFNGFDRKAFLRAKSFQHNDDQMKADDLHTGSSVCRKFMEIRLVLMNHFAPLLAKKMPGGQLPSGKSFAEVLLSVRKELYGLAEEMAKLKSKVIKGYKPYPFNDQWFPAEWEAFLTYGSGSPTPDESLTAM